MDRFFPPVGRGFSGGSHFPPLSRGDGSGGFYPPLARGGGSDGRTIRTGEVYILFTNYLKLPNHNFLIAENYRIAPDINQAGSL